jgi:hypothetical protein
MVALRLAVVSAAVLAGCTTSVGEGETDAGAFGADDDHIGRSRSQFSCVDFYGVDLPPDVQANYGRDPEHCPGADAVGKCELPPQPGPTGAGSFWTVETYYNRYISTGDAGIWIIRTEQELQGFRDNFRIPCETPSMSRPYAGVWTDIPYTLP